MKIVGYLHIFLLTLFFFSCKQEKVKRSESIPNLIENSQKIQEKAEKLKIEAQKQKDSILQFQKAIAKLDTLPVDSFVDISHYSKDFILDMKYATADNFLKAIVYDCPKCNIRATVAIALLKANREFMERGYRITFFDCYRPYSVQKKMWKIFPDPGYVADPKGGSIHNKGAAVDITLAKLDGGFVDMGTDFDHFGRESRHSNQNLPKEVIENRKLLRSTMEKYGFKTIRTEWWHYNYIGGLRFKISDFRWECD